MSLSRASLRPSRPDLAPALGAGPLLALLALLALVAGLVATPGAEAADRRARVTSWAPAETATIHPGVQMFTSGAQCTGNFVFTDARGGVYVGYAAHCAGLGEATDTDGCSTASVPLGTRVRFATGATLAGGGTTLGRGRLAYSSWRAMRAAGTSNADACAFNDFALVKVDAADVREVNPSVPFSGGPVGLADSSPAAGEVVRSYGQSSLRPTTLLSPKVGTSLGATSPWSSDVLTLTPGVPGDSGSGFLDAEGRAFGTLSTIALAPLAGTNGLGDLARELAFARRTSGIEGLRLAPGTEPFRPPL
ncbi:hypothetical protein [Nocardioides sp. Leaf285]|uniref:hypothetical protein n=1 Tax=Nocardioides sp. Leaf285 TaxID=1736322 RepID=UPI00070326D7|nr:hypothetical protein [Nocardioides sp. Leaf285]KQP64462.1 hypothetical protein ASF47_10860 [Nocardioides sp. Leaf285]